MGKSDAEVIALFHEQVNMTADEIEAWLEKPESHKAGTGVGLESGRKIIDILRRNPVRNAEAYDPDDMEHIRKVVGYNSRHLAQEDHLRDTKTVEELEKTKSTISLRNWGHDPVKVKIHEEQSNSPESEANEKDNAELGSDVDASNDCSISGADREKDQKPAQGKAATKSTSKKPKDGSKRKRQVAADAAPDGDDEDHEDAGRQITQRTRGAQEKEVSGTGKSKTTKRAKVE